MHWLWTFAASPSVKSCGIPRFGSGSYVVDRRFVGAFSTLFACLQSILITGATSGIGEALAVHYAQPGVTLSLTGRNRQALQETERKCAAKGAKVYTKAIDVTDRDALSSWIHEVDQKDPIDMVFANAGVTENTTNTVNDLEAAARTVFDINVTGVFNTIFPVIPAMKERGYGQVVLLSSLASFGALNNSAAYCASKAAIRVYGDGLRTDLLRYGIHVNVVCPGVSTLESLHPVAHLQNLFSMCCCSL